MSFKNKTALQKFLTSQILAVIPRLLTQVDRDDTSPTFGCFDRNYWHYKIRDFSSMVLHQNVYALALLHENYFEGNYLHQQKEIKKLILGALSFWKKNMHRNGSFDEYWPNEQGYPPLVFSTYAVLKTIQLLKLDKLSYQPALQKAVARILKYQEKQALNQEAAGLAVLNLYADLFTDQSVKTAYQSRLSDFLSHQSFEGWFPEYGGADIGYSSVNLHFLSDLSEVSPAVKSKLLSFLVNFVHLDGSTGGEYGSRNTEYFLLGGLVKNIDDLNSQRILFNLDWSLKNFDDRYLFHYVFMSYVEGCVRLLKSKNLRFQKIDPEEKYFSESGLLVKRTKGWLLISNLKKGGTYKLFVTDQLRAKSGSYRGQKSQLIYTTCWLNHASQIKVSKNKAILKTSFARGKYLYPSLIRNAGLRVLALLPWKRKLINWLKKILIYSASNSDFKLQREFSWNKSMLTIDDQLITNQPFKAQEKFEAALRFVPSSKFASAANYIAQNQLSNLNQVNLSHKQQVSLK